MVWWNPSTWARLNANATALKANIQTYVNAYTNVRNKNNKNALPPINAKLVNSLKRYINSKRPKAAGAAAAAVNNAGGNNANAAAAAAGAANATGSSPNNVGAAAAKPLLALEAPPAQVAAAAAGAAKQQALALGMGSNAANNAGALAAANAANAARPNATPAQAAQTATAGAAAAGLNANAQGNAAQAAAAAAVQPGESGSSAPREMNINVPGSNTKVKVKRNNPGSNWYFANSVNNSKYNLNNRNKNVPTIRNISSGNMFKQAQSQRPAPRVNNRNVNAIRARLNGPNMTPGNWYRYAASLGYNTGKYANDANRLMASGNKKALSTFILKSMMTVHPNKGNRSNAKNQQIRNLLTRNLTKARNNLSKN
jgi:hypothetical protein